MSEESVHSGHTDVGAYALGLLGDAEATRFEEHLAGCPRCAEELEANLALGPVLREAADADGRLPERPDDEALLTRLLTDATRVRRAQRRRRGVLVGAAAAAVLAAGAVTVPAVTGPDDTAPPPAATAAETAFRQGEQFSDHDPATSVRATVSLQARPWGTHVALRIGNLTGPRSCDLVAVGEDGSRQTVTTWSVPGYGYGIDGTRYAKPLYVAGGAGLSPDRIDHFEVRTLQGEKLAAIQL